MNKKNRVKFARFFKIFLYIQISFQADAFHGAGSKPPRANRKLYTKALPQDVVFFFALWGLTCPANPIGKKGTKSNLVLFFATKLAKRCRSSSVFRRFPLQSLPYLEYFLKTHNRIFKKNQSKIARYFQKFNLSYVIAVSKTV